MITRRTALGALAGAIALPARRAQAQATPAERAAMAQVAAGFMARFGVPGLAVAIARRGTMVYEEGFGWAIDGRERVTPASLFRIASVSKPITAVTVMSLVERNLLRRDARVFAPGGPLGRHPIYERYVPEVTVEHLLTHTAGGWPNDATDPMFRNPRMGHEQLIDWAIASVPLTQPPGAYFAYSNFGYCVLGRVIERVTGRPYADYVRDTVLARCGAAGMRIAGNTRAERAAAEVAYYGQGGEDPYAIKVARMDSHGGWLASAGDLVRFAVHVDGFDDAPSTLAAETIRLMTTSTAANPEYARGWQVNHRHNWWHAGTLPGTVAIMVRTASGLCWAALANSRRRGAGMEGALDAMMWEMARKVPAWQA
jgi:CubicO group peptidase (beta-lactamase class C family)